MRWHLENFKNLRLDIVGLIAVLGEGSVTRNAQVTSLCWWSTVPRLLPAPQALLEHARKQRLPTSPGIVVGAYSGTVRREINFFATLLHGPPPPDYVVELVLVERNDPVPEGEKPPRSFSALEFGALFWLSIFGFAMSVALFVLAIVYDDAFGLLAVMMLSAVSSFVGFGSHWSLAFKEPPKPKPQRGNVLPRSDVVIYYPNGAMRVIRAADEGISRLYFQVEHCEYLINDTVYRGLALFATVMLMAGVVSLANATSKIQVAFAAAYVLLNILYWIASALNPAKHHWKTAYKTDMRTFKLQTGRAALERTATTMTTRSATLRLKQQLKERWVLWVDSIKPKRHKSLSLPFDPNARNFTAALWAAIFLTGTAQWLNQATNIAPINQAWKDWLEEAEKQVQLTGKEAEFAAQKGSAFLDVHQIQPTVRISTDMMTKQTTAVDADAGKILIPDWDYQGELTKCLERYAPQTRRKLMSDLPEPSNRLSEEPTQGLPTVSEV